MYKNTAGEKKHGESKIPKILTAKDKSSEAFIEKKVTQRCQANAAISSEKAKQLQANSTQNVKRMSLEKISKDVQNHFQTENPSSDDLPEKSSATLVRDKENSSKRVPAKEKPLQRSQTFSGRIPNKPSTWNSKTIKTHGGIKFVVKKPTYQKPDRFEKLKEELKTHNQDTDATELNPEGIKTNDPAQRIIRKNIERLNNRNLENSPNSEAESPKNLPDILEENVIKNSIEYHGLKFAPKWQSTPLKLDLFEKINEESNYEDSSLEWLTKTPMFSKAMVKEKADKNTVDAKEAEHLPTGSPTTNETDIKICTAFTGIRLSPKKKSTFKKTDIFENVLMESQKDKQDRKPSGTSTECTKMSSKAANLRTESQQSRVEKLKQTSTQMAEKSETKSSAINLITESQQSRVVKSKQTSTQMAEKLKTKSSATNLRTESQQSRVEKLKQTSTQMAEKSDATTISKKKGVSKPVQTCTGLRLKPRQKTLLDIFEAQKAKSDSHSKAKLNLFPEGQLLWLEIWARTLT